MSAETDIHAGYALPGPDVASAAPSHDYAALLGRAATLKPAGENARLDAVLPQRGLLTRQIALANWGSDWLVVTFAEPFDYDGVQVCYCLIRARWVGHPVGADFCPVFVLIDKEDALSSKRHWSSKDFQFIAWADVEVDEI